MFRIMCIGEDGLEWCHSDGLTESAAWAVWAVVADSYPEAQVSIERVREPVVYYLDEVEER